jgi:hypothetical protein
VTYRSRPLLDLCRDKSCACCGALDGTIVAAHRNGGGQKGMGIKSSDAWSLPLCRGCHADYDQGRWKEADEMWLLMYAVHMDELFSAGLVAPVGRQTREKAYKQGSKILKHPGVISR